MVFCVVLHSILCIAALRYSVSLLSNMCAAGVQSVATFWYSICRRLLLIFHVSVLSDIPCVATFWSSKCCCSQSLSCCSLTIYALLRYCTLRLNLLELLCDAAFPFPKPLYYFALMISGIVNVCVCCCFPLFCFYALWNSELLLSVTTCWCLLLFYIAALCQSVFIILWIAVPYYS